MLKPKQLPLQYLVALVIYQNVYLRHADGAHSILRTQADGAAVRNIPKKKN